MIASVTRFSRFRRWGYTLLVIVGALRIPAQAHFRLYAPLCDLRMAWDNLRLSVTKVPHFAVFAVFFTIVCDEIHFFNRACITESVTLRAGALTLITFVPIKEPCPIVSPGTLYSAS